MNVAVTHTSGTTIIHDDDDDDDSSIEYIGTLPANTTVATTVTTTITGEADTDSTTVVSPPTNALKSRISENDDTVVIIPSLQPLKNENDHPNANNSKSEKNSNNIYRSSIYVQNLAEICYTILYDRRWNIRIQPLPSLPMQHSSSSLSVLQQTTTNSSRKRPRMRTTTSHKIDVNEMHHTDTTDPEDVVMNHLNDTKRHYSSHSKSSSPPPPPLTQPLFQWEYGDDCKIILLLSRLYQSSHHHHHHHHPKQNHSTMTTPMPLVTAPTEPHGTSIQQPQQPHPMIPNKTPTVVSSLHDDRKFYLYCRLYYRKGPWFRIDDIYQKYYDPFGKGLPYNTIRYADVSSLTDNGHPDITVVDEDLNITMSHPNNMNDHPFLQPCLTMIQDLYELYNAGYIRFFNTEMECGQTIGGGTTTSLLKLEEQQIILSKLGGGSNRHAKNSQKATTNNNTNGNHSKSHHTKNRIWQQMRQQTSIRTSFVSSETTKSNNNNNKKNNNSNVLPVRNHVETLLTHKLVQLIYQSATTTTQQHSPPQQHARNEDVTSATRVSLDNNKSTQLPSKQFIRNFIQHHIQNLFQSDRIMDSGNEQHDSTKQNQNVEPIYISCFRLCELPLLTLRRCVRLYLCATSGPGVMRSTPNNGYRSCACSPISYFSNPSTGSKKNTSNTVASSTGTTSNTTTTAIEPPQSWHHVQYPSMSYCFGFTSAPYYNAYQPLLVHRIDDKGNNRIHNNNNHHHTNHRVRPVTIFQPEQVFPTYMDFLRWEKYVEVRSYVDYLLELNERYRSEVRKRHVGASNIDPMNESSPTPQVRSNSNSTVKDPIPDNATTKVGLVDCMALLSANGRRNILEYFVTQTSGSSLLCDHIEMTVADASLTKLVGPYEQVLGVIGIIIICILTYHYQQHQGNNNESASIISLQERPWLRHMSWLAGLALIVFDIIPIFERRGLYFLAVQSLQVLLYGSFPVGTNVSLNRAELIDQLLQQQRTCSFPPWISRRARGKSIVRLIIDCGQIPLHQIVNDTASDKMKAKIKKASSDAIRQAMVQFCQEFIVHAAMSGCVGFSAIRTLARRLKQPLEHTLSTLRCVEAHELGIRLSNLKMNVVNHFEKKAYSDWNPVTDYFVANSIDRDKIEPGSRCAFVGFEDDMDHSLLSSSLNVEELAMDLYRTGRLPNCIDDNSNGAVQGGWTGWHNEGNTIRTLFRIMCGGPLLRMDFGNVDDTKPEADLLEYATVHLSPYQQGPFHLLVGYELQKVRVNANDDDSFYISSPSFYCKSADKISHFLAKLSVMNGQELCDMVYDAVASRLDHVCLHKLKDPFLTIDIVQLRTLSALAAGFGGKCLAAMFRCLLFDYRHYAGGLPDLHLFRAYYHDETTAHIGRGLVELGDWIGESFSKDNQQSYDYQRVLQALADDEFLGLDKPNDRKTRTQMSGGTPGELGQLNTFSIEMLPERLQLSHNDCAVHVECMMVEVKSSNDRLDPRQEDWLNVIDLHGNSRVCKFVDSEKSRNGDIGLKSMS